MLLQNRIAGQYFYWYLYFNIFFIILTIVYTLFLLHKWWKMGGALPQQGAMSLFLFYPSWRSHKGEFVFPPIFEVF